MAKYIYEFELQFDSVEDVAETSTNENGETVTITKKVKKQVPVKFGLRKPTKSDKDEFDLENKVFYSHAIQKGILPFSVLYKNIVDSGGVLTKQDLKRKEEITEEYGNLQKELAGLEDRDKAKEILIQLQKLLEEIDGINKKELSIYNMSAEGYARGKMISSILVRNSWNITENKPFFKGKTREESLDYMESIDDGDNSFEKTAMTIFVYLVGVYMNAGDIKINQGDLDQDIARIVNEQRT